MKTVTIVPKDSAMERLYLNNVLTWFHSHGAFTFITLKDDGSKQIKCYPDIHIWYVSTEVKG